MSRWQDAGAQLGSAVYSGLNDTPVRVAVTGLSRAGKTVFLTSLLSNLLAMRKGVGAARRRGSLTRAARLRRWDAV